jgi:hypothetical protein
MPHGEAKLTAPLIIHVDGEFFCRPEDDVRSVEIEVVPAALTIVKVCAP